MGDFMTLYPGVCSQKEKPHVEKYLADNRAIEERGQIDITALINGTLPEGTPGVGPIIKVNEAMVRYNNQKYDPENPVLNDAAYAQKLGYQDIQAYPTFGAHDDTFMSPYPSEARDSMGGSGLNHSVTSYRPVYPGDTIYLVVNSRHMVDLTPPEGCVYRSAAIQSEGSVYNQKGEKVSDVIFRVTENAKIYKEGKGPKNPTFADKMETIDWMRRPLHYYTDDDWEFIRDIWAKEKRQGAVPLYWEDVKIGDEPAWTLDGPIEESCVPTPPWGMGIGGSRTLKKEIMDPGIFKTMIRGETDGIYRLPNREDYVPPVPDDPATGPAMETPRPTSSAEDDTAEFPNTSAERGILINYFGRDIAIRHVHNWMGDYGWLYNIRWGISSPELQSTYGQYAVVNPRAERFLEKIPKMKGKFLTTHGLIGDVAIVKSYVYDKYVRDDAFLVELGWWIETIDGYLWEEGGATVKLPSRKV